MGDSTSLVNAHVTPSLSQTTRIVVNTANDAIPSIVNVAYAPSIKDDERVSFGPGDAIIIDVLFSQDVALFQTFDGGIMPQIALNVVGAEAVYGELVPKYQEGFFTRTLSFRYIVKNGHSQTELDFSASDALHCNDYTIEDVFGRRANLTLPVSGSSKSLWASKSISISDSPPVIEHIAVDLLAGEYGAGEEVNFIVTFDRHVTVTGNPGLPLNVQSSVLVLEILAIKNDLLPETFFSLLYRGERSRRIPSNASAMEMKDAVESLLSIGGDVCVSRSPSQSAVGFRWAIRFMGLNDFIRDMHVDDSGLAVDFFSINTNILNTNSALIDWNADDGDAIMCTTRAASYTDGSGTKSLRFSFSLLPGDYTEKLDRSQNVGAEVVLLNDEDHVSLMTNSYGTASIQADLKIEAITIDNHVAVNTAPPVVIRISPQESSTPNGTYAVGDSLFFEVVFDKPVDVSWGMQLN